jgi:hypothetical protein
MKGSDADICDGGQVTRETLDEVVIEREGRWIVVFRGEVAILGVRSDHLHSLQVVPTGQAF